MLKEIDLYIIFKNNYPIEVHKGSIDSIKQRVANLEWDDLDVLNKKEQGCLSRFSISCIVEAHSVDFERCCGCNTPLYSKNKSKDGMFCNECVHESLKNV